MASKGINGAGWGLLGAVGLTVLFSFLPWYSVTFLGLTASANAWNSFWWLPVVVAIGVGVVYALDAFNTRRMSSGARRALPIAGLISFGLTVIVLVYILARGTSALTIGDSGALGDGETVASSGPGFGLFLALLSTAAVAYFASLVSRESGFRMPFRRTGSLR